ncbi:hypothetical protein M3Y96_00453800 [Aphelenchoides besseyi]|nr:hypothetical protein M3Y96_00453800 [Aphelenchoides besseyi]
MFEFSSRLINITDQQPPTQLMEQLVFPILVSNLLAIQLIFQCATKKSKEKTTKRQRKPRNVVDKQENELQIRRPKKDGVAGTYDPNYQTLAGINDRAFDPQPKPPADQGALAGTHDPNYQTLAAIDNNCFQKPNGAFPRPDGGFAIPPAKSPAAPPHPPAQLGMAQTHDPNYQTLAGIGGDVFKK